MKREKYLTEPEQYALVYKKGNSWANDLLVMKALANRLTLSRYGFSVSKRIGNAVTRNKVKRLLREVMRIMPLEPGWDIIFITRPTVATAGYADVKKSIEGLLTQARLLMRDYEGACSRIN